MLAGLLALSNTQAGIATDINRYLKMIGNDASFRVQIQATQSEYGKTLTQAIDFSRTARQGVRFDLLEPIQNKWDRQHRSIFLFGGKATVVDRITSNYLVLDLPKLPDPVQSVRMAGLEVPEPATFFLDPKIAESVLKPLASAKGWIQSSVSGGKRYSLKQGSGKTARAVQIRFGSKGSLEEFFVNDHNREVHWRIKPMGKPQPAQPVLPKRAVKVISFVERLAPPKWQDPTAKRFGTMAIDFLDRLVDGRVIFRDDTGVVRIAVSGSKVAEESMASAWAYDGSVLTVQAHSTKLFGEGKVGSGRVPGQLQRFYVEPKLLTRRFMARENFLRLMLPPAATVRSAGSMKLGGEDVAILEAKVDSTRIQFSVRKRDGALVDLTSRALDRKGKTITQSRYGFQFLEIGKVAPSATFRLKTVRGYRDVKL